MALANMTRAQSIRFGLVYGQSASRRRGEPFSTEIIFEIEGETQGRARTRKRYELIHPKGQAPLTALGALASLGAAHRARRPYAGRARSLFRGRPYRSSLRSRAPERHRDAHPRNLEVSAHFRPYQALEDLEAALCKRFQDGESRKREDGLSLAAAVRNRNCRC